MITLTGFSGILVASIMDSYEENRDFFWIIFPCLLIACVTYTSIIPFLIYLESTNELLVHLENRPCQNGEACRFKNRYKKIISRRKFGKILSKNKSRKIANLYMRITETLLSLKNTGKTDLQNKGKNSSKDSKCFICCQNPPGFAFLPCLHTGVCINCGIESLDPEKQKYNGNELRCPMCRKKPTNVFFYREDENGVLEGLGIKDLKSVLGMSQQDFEKIFEV